ncbi:unnamed protein product [Hermetia illucens]|uniref:Myotubularin-related protein 14 n=2 Tax=Hermetia illucens TaxID=343691 RepID=A0A7R8UA84_HERIL|nr:unnamed protein product [Hermetia illucens]
MTTNELSETPLGRLLTLFEQNAYSAGGCEKDTTEYEIIEHCSRLLRLDYDVIELPNLHGEHCSQYPARILIPESEKLPLDRELNAPQHTAQETIYEGTTDLSRLLTIIPQAKFARCRKRFPVPVILFRGKYICRSSTVSLNMESSGRRVLEIASQKVGDISDTIRNVCSKLVGGGEKNGNLQKESGNGNSNSEVSTTSSSTYSSRPASEISSDEQPDYEVLDLSVLNNDPVYKYDLDLLKALDIGAIADLMVEMKKVKFWMFVSSSEKADEMNRYAGFEIISIPYPGCEFFKIYREHSYEARQIRFDWDQNFVDAEISIPANRITQSLQFDWRQYKRWDLVEITQNYLKIILKYIQDLNKGILIHCISGWDRTPLFISLVRLSLWADGLIHKSLTAAEITYFTVAYDWYLFGHQLPDRRAKLEEILFFCFDFLKYIETDDYQVVNTTRVRTKTSSSTSSMVIIDADTDVFDDENVSPNASRLDNTAAHKSSTESLSMNRSPQKKSSPVSVPGRRQRNDSTSDWQNVTETGSLEKASLPYEPGTRAYMERANARNNTACRQERLKCVRAYFIKIYANVLDFHGGNNSGLRDLLENFAARIADTFR